MKKTTVSPLFKSGLFCWLRPVVKSQLRNRDYHCFAEDLECLSSLLISSGLESLAGDLSSADSGCAGRRDRGIFALRVVLLQHWLGFPSYREYSRQLAGNALLQDFCGLWRLDGKIGLTSKSTLGRCHGHFSAEQWELLHVKLTEVLSDGEGARRCDLVSSLSTAVAQMDSTCLEANIHFPTDWVLLKDVSVSLLSGVKRIRTSGIVCRMPESVEQLSRQMNVICMQMSQLRRKADAARLRKGCLRQMKRLLQRISGHARRHRDALQIRGSDHGWSPARRDRLLERMDWHLQQLPEVIHQAHERIIGGRKLPRDKKILSIHDPDLQVIVRGKASGEVEFGNSLFIVENSLGYILDYQFDRAFPQPEPVKLQNSIERMHNNGLCPDAVVADRGFDCKKTDDFLHHKAIVNLVIPKNPQTLSEKLQDPCLAFWIHRRGRIEARISIVKNHANSRVCRAKGFSHRAQWVAVTIVAHNLRWVIRKLLINKKSIAPPKAA